MTCPKTGRVTSARRAEFFGYLFPNVFSVFRTPGGILGDLFSRICSPRVYPQRNSFHEPPGKLFPGMSVPDTIQKRFHRNGPSRSLNRELATYSDRAPLMGTIHLLTAAFSQRYPVRLETIFRTCAPLMGTISAASPQQYYVRHEANFYFPCRRLSRRRPWKVDFCAFCAIVPKGTVVLSPGNRSR